MNDEPKANDAGKPTIDDDAWREELAAALAPRSPWRLIHLIYFIVGLAVLLWLIVTFAGVIVPLIFIMGAGLLIGGAVVLARGRSSQQDALLWMLSIAAEHNMPLATTVAAFAGQYSGRYRRRVLRVAALLDGGMSLPEALERTPRVVSHDALLLAHVGYESGRLAEALRTAVTLRAVQAPIRTAVSNRVAYVVGVLLIMLSIVGFIMYYIIPKFISIFNDFGLPLPPVTIAVIEAFQLPLRFFALLPLFNSLAVSLIPSAFTGGLGALTILFISFFLFPVLIALLLWLSLFVFAGWMNKDVPILGRLLKRRHTALILRSLAFAVEGGRTMEAGLMTLANHYPTRWVKKKLTAAARETREGMDWREALLRRGLLRRTDYEVLSTASAVGNLPWAMNELAESAERRNRWRIQALVQTLFPLAICAIGALVLVVVFAFFAPLVDLIGRLSG